MLLTTPIIIPQSSAKISPTDKLLFVGSCFADNIGRRFSDNAFLATVNPYGVMYNPVSVLHTLERLLASGNSTESLANHYDWIVITLGTNHVYREKATGKIVDNCQKRPQNLFQEEVMTVEECVQTLWQCVALCPDSHVIFTVSPIRYRKYGFHESQLSKSTLLLAIDTFLEEFKTQNQKLKTSYFPAYELVLDELRDYRFYAPDMLHPSEQAVDYIFERFQETYFSSEALQFYKEYQPIKQALNHKPFNPVSEEYKSFLAETQQKLIDFKKRWFIQ